MFAPDIHIARVNLKPLLPPGEMRKLSPDNVLKRLRREILRQIKRNIRQEAFSPQAKKLLLKALQIKMGPNSVTVITKDPAFRPLLEGQKKGQMRWLTKAKRPIPIVLDSGKLIFRSATPKSMKDGKWVHPGRQPTTVIEKAREATRETLKRQLKKELARQIEAAAQRSRSR